MESQPTGDEGRHGARQENQQHVGFGIEDVRFGIDVRARVEGIADEGGAAVEQASFEPDGKAIGADPDAVDRAVPEGGPEVDVPVVDAAEARSNPRTDDEGQADECGAGKY